jgi:hypothetical protein
MRHRKSMTFLLAVAICATPTFMARASEGQPVAGEGDVQAQSGSTGASRSGAQILGAVPEPSQATVNQIRQEGEAILTGTHWSYDQAGRRDPFRSLVENVRIKGEGERPQGIEGMLITEVDIVGIVTSPRGDLVFLNGSDNRGYFLREGDALYDGQVKDIDRAAGRVVFRQKVEDPREIKPYREVVKKLHTSTEDGQ